MLGPLAILIAKDLGLSDAQKGMMVATPLLAGALLRIVMGVLVDHLKPKKAGMIGQLIVDRRVMAGGIGGFYLASSLGYSKQLTGSYQLGLSIFASLAIIALLGLSMVKARWRTTWGSAAMTSAKI